MRFYRLNQNVKQLFNIDLDHVPLQTLHRGLYYYARSNNLLDKYLYRVDANLAMVFNLTDDQIALINNATSTTAPGCLSWFNCVNFITTHFKQNLVVNEQLHICETPEIQFI